MIGKYADTSLLAQNGVTIGGKKYMYLSSTDKVIRAKKGTSGVHAIKTTQSNYIFFFSFYPKKTAVCLLPLEKQVHYYSHITANRINSVYTFDEFQKNTPKHRKIAIFLEYKENLSCIYRF